MVTNSNSFFWIILSQVSKALGRALLFEFDLRCCLRCAIRNTQHGQVLGYHRKRTISPVLLGFVYGLFDVHLSLASRGKSVRLAVGSLRLFLRQVFHRAMTIAFGFLSNPSLSLPSGFYRIFIIKN